MSRRNVQIEKEREMIEKKEEGTRDETEIRAEERTKERGERRGRTEGMMKVRRFLQHKTEVATSSF